MKYTTFFCALVTVARVYANWDGALFFLFFVVVGLADLK